MSLSCVYVDVNGLHELNNASGHEKGDQMLQTVALELQGRFGRDNCYRTGGDEFVAFVQDEPETAVRAATDELIPGTGTERLFGSHRGGHPEQAAWSGTR